MLRRSDENATAKYPQTRTMIDNNTMFDLRISNLLFPSKRLCRASFLRDVRLQ
jgi:hypothetical protein